MDAPRTVEVNIEPELQDAFRDVLRQAPRAVNVGHLVALCFEAGVRAERARASRSLPQQPAPSTLPRQDGPRRGDEVPHAS